MIQAEHVAALCKAFKIILRVDKRMPVDRAVAFVLPNGRQGVHIGPVTEDCSYAVALHEIGHCVAPLGRVHGTEGSLTFRKTGRPSTLRDVHLKLTAEEAAWDWAEHHALDWTVAMAQVRRISYDSYRAEARRFGVRV